MPFPNEHSARLANPERFVRFRRQNDRGGRGIDFVFGIRPRDKPGPRGGRTVLQSIRFDVDLFTPAQAQKWLRQREFQVLKFEPATRRGRRAQVSGAGAPMGAMTMPNQRLTPTAERPILAFQPTDREGRAVTPPIPLNPLQAMRLMGRLPDAVTLASLDYFQGIGGLGRMMMEVALEDVVAPQLTGAARDAAGATVGAGPSAVTVVFDPIINPQQFPVEEADDVLQIAGRGGASQYGFHRSGVQIPQLLFELARVGLSRLRPFVRSGARRGRFFAGRAQLAGGFGGQLAVGLANASATKLGASIADTLTVAARKLRKSIKGPTADTIASIITSAKSIAAKLRDPSGRSISPSEALDMIADSAKDLAKARRSGGKVTAAEVLELLKRRARDLDKLLGIELAQRTLVAGETIGDLAAIDAAALGAPASAWRPHLGEYTAACLAHPRGQRGSLDGLARAVKLGMFDGSPQSERLAASSLLGYSQLSGRELSQTQMGEITQLGLSFRARASSFLRRLVRSRNIPRTLVNAAQGALSSLLRSRTNVRRIVKRGRTVSSQQKSIAARLQALERRRATAAPTAATLAALNRARRDLTQALSMLRKERTELAKLLEREKRRVADAKKVARGTVKAAVAEAKKAEGGDQARGVLAQALKENGFLRGQVMLLSKREFQQGIKDLAEAKEGKKKLEAIARTLSQARKSDAKKLRDLKLLIVKTKAKLREAQARANLVTRQTGIDQEVKRQREALLTRLTQLKDSFKGELFRIKNITDEAVQKAGDVVSKTGVNLMFKFLRQMTQGMRDIKDVTDAGEFLRLFPQVLQQLKLAQEIAAPDAPTVTVNVPQLAPPNITIQPPSFRLSPQFEIKSPDVTIQEGDVTVQVVPGETKAIPSGEIAA